WKARGADRRWRAARRHARSGGADPEQAGAHRTAADVSRFGGCDRRAGLRNRVGASHFGRNEPAGNQRTQTPAGGGTAAARFGALAQRDSFWMNSEDTGQILGGMDMTINFRASDVQELKPRITVLGVGGAGGNAVNNMINAKLEGVSFVVANTDAQ